MDKILKKFFAFLGILSAVAGIATIPNQFSYTGKIISVILISSFISYALYEYIRRRFSRTSFGCCGIPGYGIRMAKLDDLRKICDLQKYFYGNDGVPLQLYQEWFEANPEGFFVLQKTTFNADNTFSKELIGHFTFLAVKSDIFNIYRQGKMIEQGIRGENLYKPNEKSKMDSIYIESLMIEDDPISRSEGIRIIIRMMDTMLSKFCGDHNPESVFAMAATDNGVKTLEKWGFVLDPNSEEPGKRLDKHPMYISDFIAFKRKLKAKEDLLEMDLMNEKLSSKI